MSRNVAEIFSASPEGQPRPGETDEQYGQRSEAGGRALSTAPDGRNYCEHPEIAPPDSNFHTVDRDVPAFGIDLDDRVSTAATDGPRADFTRPDGTRGVDNQFYRAVGCTRSYQSTGQSNAFETEMYTGSWGILIRIENLDDIRNDDEVRVIVSANADPIQLSPTRQALDYATYAMDQDRSFRTTTRGRIVNGLLTTEPFDLQLRSVTNSMRLRRVLRGARIRATLEPDGTLGGYLAGYSPVEAMYNTHFGFRDGVDAQRQLSRLRGHSANGAARVLGYTCQGVYQALNRFADGNPDPRTGRFTSISTQYRFQAVPAFIVDAATQGANQTESPAYQQAHRGAEFHGGNAARSADQRPGNGR